jgi:hypothetical protein
MYHQGLQHDINLTAPAIVSIASRIRFPSSIGNLFCRGTLTARRFKALDVDSRGKCARTD